MLGRLAYRMVSTSSPRTLWKFLWNFGLGGMRSMRRFRRRIAGGRQFPPFLFLSVTSRCNLRCQGCWVATDGPPADLDVAAVGRIIHRAAEQGTRFFGILGGEPLLYDGLFDLFQRHPNCYFQLFTNGTLITADAARRLRRAGNVTPLVSIEGDAAVSDQRRGGRDVHARTLAGLRHCLDARLITGVATSVCKSNLADLASESHLDRLIDLGVHYVWFYAYRPSGPNPCPELALSPDELVTLRRFIVEMRCRKPIIIVDTYYDAEGRALCPAAEGMSYHVNPWGDIEPCPPIQFAVESVGNGDDVVGRIDRSAFLKAFRDFASRRTRGCVLLEAPQELREFLLRQGARDTTGRGTGFDELVRMAPRASQHLPGREIPEKHWLYRFAKRHWFFGFGGYA
ncbi:MAG TPA: radical SAM/SPASM domain-containing protein [Phycisphaerae bacterium]|nr:radical SAM/SPASM domain-containing protein [Phycisphaerae bacterium]